MSNYHELLEYTIPKEWKEKRDGFVKLLEEKGAVLEEEQVK